jgi:hypothetical protein
VVAKSMVANLQAICGFQIGAREGKSNSGETIGGVHKA